MANQTNRGKSLAELSKLKSETQIKPSVKIEQTNKSSQREGLGKEAKNKWDDKKEINLREEKMGLCELGQHHFETPVNVNFSSKTTAMDNDQHKTLKNLAMAGNGDVRYLIYNILEDFLEKNKKEKDKMIKKYFLE
jgi:hypothetical protein